MSEKVSSELGYYVCSSRAFFKAEGEGFENSVIACHNYHANGLKGTLFIIATDMINWIAAKGFSLQNSKQKIRSYGIGFFNVCRI